MCLGGLGHGTYSGIFYLEHPKSTVRSSQLLKCVVYQALPLLSSFIPVPFHALKLDGNQARDKPTHELQWYRNHMGGNRAGTSNYIPAPCASRADAEGKNGLISAYNHVVSARPAM